MKVGPTITGIGRHDLASLVARLEQRLAARRRWSSRAPASGATFAVVAANSRSPSSVPNDVVNTDR